jgi:hypothetical protein
MAYRVLVARPAHALADAGGMAGYEQAMERLACCYMAQNTRVNLCTPHAAAGFALNYRIDRACEDVIFPLSCLLSKTKHCSRKWIGFFAATSFAHRKFYAAF